MQNQPTAPTQTPTTPAKSTRKKVAVRKVQTKGTKSKNDGHLHKSKVATPVSRVHDFLDSNRKLRRSEAIRALEKKGIAYYTARTQYQVWYTERNANKSKGRKVA